MLCAQIIRQLKLEMEKLRSQLANQAGDGSQGADAIMQSQKLKLEEERAQFEREKEKMLESISMVTLIVSPSTKAPTLIPF